MNREDSELILFFDYVRIAEKEDPRLAAIYHVANERKTSPQAGRYLKRKGVKSGVPDICVPIPHGPKPGLYIELKIAPNKLTDNQHAFCTLLHTFGYNVKVAFSGEQAWKIVQEYLYG